MNSLLGVYKGKKAKRQKSEDVIAWRDGKKIICAGCGDPGGAEPLTKDDFDDGDIVECGICNKRIL